jgi:signal transduction histidine kinase
MIDTPLDAVMGHKIGDLVEAAEAEGLTALIERGDLGEIVTSLVEQMSEDAGKAQCEFRLKIETGVMVRCDRFRLEQAILNVLSNALKYAPGHPVTLVVERSDAQGVVMVEDRGVGIDPDALTRIFNRFERAGSQSAGLGLGLYIAREIVNQHGGTIRAERREGGGSRFRITIPVSVMP